MSQDAAQTDQQKMLALFTELGLGFTVDQKTGALLCTEFNERVAAYPGFYAAFEFDQAGRFVQLKLRE